MLKSAPLIIRVALLATLIPVKAFSQTVAAVTPPSPPAPYWIIDGALTGTFTPLGGDTGVGLGASVSVAIMRAKREGEYSHGTGVVGVFTRAWSDESTVVTRRENWALVGVQRTAFDDVGRFSLQVFGGLKSVAFDSSSPSRAALPRTYAAVGLGMTWDLPVVSDKVGIRIMDFSWFATPGDPLSTHRFSLAFGIDVFPLGYVGH